jgi:glycosyltransferase involved in cell wall biosynthesis
MQTSMVISTFNRAHLLQHNLRRLAALTLPDEILVIDDGGEDNTEEVCAMAPLHLPIRYIYTHNPGSSICSHARNIGIKEASYDWIITAEPELCFRTDVVAQFEKLQPEHRSEIISAGRVWFAPDGWQPEGDISPPQGSGEAVGWVAPYAALWKKEWLEELGGWDEGFPGNWGWDDIDLLTRLRINGHGQYIAQEIEAIHLYHGLGGDHNSQNERYFRSKSFSQGDETNHADLIANKERQCGIPIPRP